MKTESTLIFTGDIGFDKYMDRKWEDPAFLSEEVLSFLRSGDHLIVNVEGPLSDREKVLRKNAVASLVHSMDREAASFLEHIGADVWNICNNHIMDAGPEGIADTIAEAERRNAKTLGAGMNLQEAMRPVIFPEAGGIGLLGVGYQRACRKADEQTPGCFSWSDMDRIGRVIGEIKKECRWCIVVAHGGEEFTALPSPYTRDRYLEYLRMGADLVVSHHPHVPMNYETLPGKAVFYSLGNFVFDTDYQRSQFHTQQGIFLKLHFTESEFSFEPFGILIERKEGRIVRGDLPKIFADVQEEEYEKLLPLATKMFLENTNKQLRFLKPEEFANATEEDFVRNFYEPLRSGRVPGEVLDLQILYPIAQRETEKKWMESTLDPVKEFILEQMPSE
ncbi:MAG: CapA family protein [Lachnospiraceae bacterium]|nr:CapA family protein [Lachnospiraceae bacterium]